MKVFSRPELHLLDQGLELFEFPDAGDGRHGDYGLLAQTRDEGAYLRIQGEEVVGRHEAKRGKAAQTLDCLPGRGHSRAEVLGPTRPASPGAIKDGIVCSWGIRGGKWSDPGQAEDCEVRQLAAPAAEILVKAGGDLPYAHAGRRRGVQHVVKPDVWHHLMDGSDKCGGDTSQECVCQLIFRGHQTLAGTPGHTGIGADHVRPDAVGADDIPDRDAVLEAPIRECARWTGPDVAVDRAPL